MVGFCFVDSLNLVRFGVREALKMGNDWDDKNRALNNFFGFGIPSAPPQKNPKALADMITAIGRKRTIPLPPDENPLGNLAALRALSGYVSAESPLVRIPLTPPPPSKSLPLVGGASWARSLVDGLLKRKATVIPGRALPSINDLAVMEGRRLRAAFVYSDLHGFTKLVATQPENKSFFFLHAFVEVATRLTKLYKGEVMDVAGDRVLSVFDRPLGNQSNEPVEDAATFALQFQTIFTMAISPAFSGGGLGQLSLGIGIDYGEAVVGCVGIRDNKRLVFFGDAANNAAKLQDIAGAGETVLSAAANSRRPTYLNHYSWVPTPETLQNGLTIFRYRQFFDGDGENPVRPR
jgi:class 3 adenylate cyclase